MQINSLARGQKGISGGASYHGNPSYMAVDVNNPEETAVKRTEANRGMYRVSGSVHCGGAQMVTYKQLGKEAFL